MIASPRMYLPTLLLALLIALALSVDAAVVHAASYYKSCSLSESDRDPPGNKPTYNLTLKRHGSVTCATAKKVMNAFHKCRTRRSVTCTKKLLGHWRCTGKKTSTLSTQFYASFTCKYGSRRVKSSYQQDT